MADCVLSSIGVFFFGRVRIRAAQELGDRLTCVSYDAVLQVDPECGEIISANQACEQILGFDASALEGR